MKRAKNERPSPGLMAIATILEWALMLIIIAMLTGGFNQPPQKANDHNNDHNMVSGGVTR